MWFESLLGVFIYFINILLIDTSAWKQDYDALSHALWTSTNHLYVCSK